jgi:hypothetical protein
MSTLNGILNFSGGEYATGEDTVRIGDFSVAVAMDVIESNLLRVDVKLIGLPVNVESGIETNDDGSVSFYGGIQNDNGGGGGGGGGGSDSQ